MKRLALGAALLAFSACVGAQSVRGEVYIKNGFMTGQAYLGLPERAQRAYAMGLIDGMLLSPMLGGRARDNQWLGSCVTGYSDSQAAAVLHRALRDEPGAWHMPAHVTFYNALLRACAPRPD